MIIRFSVPVRHNRYDYFPLFFPLFVFSPVKIKIEEAVNKVGEVPTEAEAEAEEDLTKMQVDGVDSATKRASKSVLDKASKVDGFRKYFGHILHGCPISDVVMLFRDWKTASAVDSYGF